MVLFFWKHNSNEIDWKERKRERKKEEILLINYKIKKTQIFFC